MGVLSDFFLADGWSVPEYDCGREFPAEDRCQLKTITILEAAGILSVLRGGGGGRTAWGLAGATRPTTVPDR